MRGFPSLGHRNLRQIAIIIQTEQGVVRDHSLYLRCLPYLYNHLGRQ